MQSLNDPITVTEIAAIMQGLPSSKAADCQGLTCELLKLPAREVESQSAQVAAVPEYGALVECIAWIVQHLLSSGAQSVPGTLQVSSVAPVPKPLASLDAQNMDLYRGIGVGSIFKRVYERVIKNRLEPLTESLGIRAPTQCGFREGQGCLDAFKVKFTFRHLIDKTRLEGSLLWVVFVDFTKAFDHVRRDVLIAY